MRCWPPSPRRTRCSQRAAARRAWRAIGGRHADLEAAVAAGGCVGGGSGGRCRHPRHRSRRTADTTRPSPRSEPVDEDLLEPQHLVQRVLDLGSAGAQRRERPTRGFPLLTQLTQAFTLVLEAGIGVVVRHRAGAAESFSNVFPPRPFRNASGARQSSDFACVLPFDGEIVRGGHAQSAIQVPFLTRQAKPRRFACEAAVSV